MNIKVPTLCFLINERGEQKSALNIIVLAYNYMRKCALSHLEYSHMTTLWIKVWLAEGHMTCTKQVDNKLSIHHMHYLHDSIQLEMVIQNVKSYNYIPLPATNLINLHIVCAAVLNAIVSKHR